MNDRLVDIKTKSDLYGFMLEQSISDKPLTVDEQEHISKLCKQFGVNRRDLRIHYDLPKRKTTNL